MIMEALLKHCNITVLSFLVFIYKCTKNNNIKWEAICFGWICPIVDTLSKHCNE